MYAVQMLRSLFDKMEKEPEKYICEKNIHYAASFIFAYVKAMEESAGEKIYWPFDNYVSNYYNKELSLKGVGYVEFFSNNEKEAWTTYFHVLRESLSVCKTEMPEEIRNKYIFNQDRHVASRTEETGPIRGGQFYD